MDSNQLLHMYGLISTVRMQTEGCGISRLPGGRSYSTPVPLPQTGNVRESHTLAKMVRESSYTQDTKNYKDEWTRPKHAQTQKDDLTGPSGLKVSRIMG